MEACLTADSHEHVANGCFLPQALLSFVPMPYSRKIMIMMSINSRSSPIPGDEQPAWLEMLLKYLEHGLRDDFGLFFDLV